MKKRKNLADKYIECVRLVNGVSNANDRIKKKGRLWKEKSSLDPWAAIIFSGCVGLKRRMHSPFTHPFAMRMQQDVQIYIEVQMT